MPCIELDDLTPEDGERLVRKLEEQFESGKVRRAEQMPTESDAIRLMFDCRLRLIEAFGWRDAIYAPRDSSRFLSIEAGSTGIHSTYRDEKGRFWVVDDVDTWPANPVLWKPISGEGE